MAIPAVSDDFQSIPINSKQFYKKLSMRKTMRKIQEREVAAWVRVGFPRFSGQGAGMHMGCFSLVGFQSPQVI